MHKMHIAPIYGEMLPVVLCISHKSEIYENYA